MKVDSHGLLSPGSMRSGYSSRLLPLRILQRIFTEKKSRKLLTLQSASSIPTFNHDIISRY